LADFRPYWFGKGIHFLMRTCMLTMSQYPVSAQPIYLLGAPRFSSLSIRLFAGTPQETMLNITAPGLSDTSYYPQSVTFNGNNLTRSWLTHYEIGGGGQLEFRMGANPAAWDDGERPPSLSPWST